ncbi:hypothetical protein Tco_1207820 [Tanacetum coccineum]
MVYFVDNVLASGVEIILEMDFVRFFASRAGDEFVRNPDPISYDETPDFSYPPPQPQSYSCELCGNDSHYGLIVANLSTHTLEPSRRFNSICYDDDDDDDNEETRGLSHHEDEDLRTIPEKELDEFIKSSVEDLVPIPRESEDTSDSDKVCDLPFCDNSVTFSNHLFDANDDFTSSDDESLPEEDVLEENFKIYSNPLFEFDEEYISSDVNPLFNEVLEDIESKDSYVSNLDEPALLVTPLSDANEDECFDPRGDIDEIDAFLDIDVSTDIKDDHDPRSLKDEPDNDDLKSMVKVFDPEIHENIISPTYVRLPFEDHHYFSLTFVIRIFLPYLTYSMDSSLLFSSKSEDTILDPDIFAYSFYSLEPVAYESPMKIFPFFCFCPKDKGI